MRTRNVILVVASGALLAAAAALVTMGPSAPPRDDAPRAAIPSAAPRAQGAPSPLGAAEVATAYRAWLAGDGAARALFAELVRHVGKPVEPGLPAYAEIVPAPGGNGVLVRSAMLEAGTLFADAASGKILGFTQKAGGPVPSVESDRLLFEAKGDDAYAAMDARELKILPDLPGAPLAASPDGALVVVALPEGDTDAAPGVVAELWDARAGRVRGELRYPGTADGAANVGVASTGPVAVVSHTGRYVAALVEDPASAASRAALWDVTTGRLVARVPLAWTQLPVVFTPDDATAFVVTAAGGPGGATEAVAPVAVHLPAGTVEGPVTGCDASMVAYAPLGLALSADGKSLAVGAAELACVFQASPLRLAWRTPVVRPLGPLDDDLGGTRPRFVLGDRALLVESEGPPSAAVFRARDRAELARGAYAVDVGEAGKPPVTRRVDDARVILLLEDGEGALLVDVDATGAAKTRRLTPDERDGKAAPPELAGAVDEDRAMEVKADRARVAIAKRVCHVGELIVPSEMCP